ncbi:MAG: cytochrome c [Salinisphaera sp.]|nr:cytochrome c [Salinisphaera sp.]
MMRTRAVLLVAGLLALSSTAWAAEEGGHHGAQQQQPHGPEWVQQKIKTCAACHGKGGISTTPMFPIIAGQYQDYLVQALTAYREGKRSNPIMGAQAKGLTDAQIQALASYYSAQPSPLHIPTVHLEE